MAGHGAAMDQPGVPTIFDPRRRAARRARAHARAARGDGADWLSAAMADDVIERLGFLRFTGRRALVSGPGSAAIADHLAGQGLTVERAEAPDFERPLAGGPYDLIASINELDTVNDVPGALIHLARALAPGGLLLAAMPGAGSLPMLRQIMLDADGDRPAARMHPMIDSRAASALLQRAGFTRQVVDSYPLTARYGALATLVSDLRDHAIGSALADRAPPLGKPAMARAQAAFARLADADGKLSERFEVLTLTGWKD